MSASVPSVAVTTSQCGSMPLTSRSRTRGLSSAMRMRTVGLAAAAVSCGGAAWLARQAVWSAVHAAFHWSALWIFGAATLADDGRRHAHKAVGEGGTRGDGLCGDIHHADFAPGSVMREFA